MSQDDNQQGDAPAKPMITLELSAQHFESWMNNLAMAMWFIDKAPPSTVDMPQFSYDMMNIGLDRMIGRCLQCLGRDTVFAVERRVGERYVEVGFAVSLDQAKKIARDVIYHASNRLESLLDSNHRWVEVSIKSKTGRSRYKLNSSGLSLRITERVHSVGRTDIDERPDLWDPKKAKMKELMMGEAKRRAIEAQAVIKQSIPLVSSQEPVQPRGISDGSAAWQNCYNTSTDYVRQHGGSVVYGFLIHPQASRDGPVVEFEHHAIVRSSDGEWIDPSYKPGRGPLFLPDDTRPYDWDRNINWTNLAVFAHPYHCSVTDTTIPSLTVAYTAVVNEQLVYSLNPLHARRRHFKEGDDYSSYVESLGLDPDNSADVSFTTNIETVMIAFEPGEQPPEFIKDFKRRGDAHMAPEGYLPMRPAQVQSEAEEEVIGRRRRDG